MHFDDVNDITHEVMLEPQYNKLVTAQLIMYCYVLLFICMQYSESSVSYPESSFSVGRTIKTLESRCGAECG